MRHRMIAQVMTRGVIVVDRNAAFKDIVTVLTRNQVSAVPVVDERNHVLGIISEADLLAKESERGRKHPVWTFLGRGRRMRTKSAATRAHQLMTSPAITIEGDVDVTVAARLLDKHRIKRLPVVDAEGRLAGIVSRRDLLAVFLRGDRDISEEITTEIFERALCAAPGTVSADVTDGVAVLRGQLELRSMLPVAVALTHRVDGVVDVISHLTYATDDSHPPAPEPENYGILHELHHRP